ncbi:MAG: molybdopterin-dependent oxidoreductase [Oscillospiraceae bacterium]|nr:molybdopterin-dependent oxidoreductase [Oscillospiraceae bacterium]
MSNKYDRVVTTTVWSPGPGCHGGCGAKLYIKDDKVVKVEGDESHPWSCGRACSRLLAMTQYMYHKDRILYPMKRVGARGEGKFERISWDEAYGTVEQKFNDIKERFGPEAVIFCQGTGRDIGGSISFLCYAFGSPNWCQLGLAGQSCYTPRLGAMSMVQGDPCVADCSQFFEKRFDDKRFELPKYIVVWGQNPGVGCPDAFMGTWVVDCMKRGTKIICIDPRWTYFASRAEHFLQIRPGTDGALALGMLNVIIENGWHDKEFVDKWCHGFDKLSERVKEYPLSKVSAITGIPENVIFEATKAYALNRPSSIHWGLPIDMCPEGTTAAQAIADLWCITGNLDVPGGNVIARPAFGLTQYPYDTHQMKAMYGDDIMDKINSKRCGAGEYKYLANFRGWAQPDVAVQQMIDGKPYPIKAAWIQTTNMLGGQAADLNKHYRALMNMDFNVVVDSFHNPTTMAIADLILPVATFAEKESWRAWYVPLQLIRPAVSVGECKSDWEINLELARRFNPKFKEKYPSFQSYVDERMKSSGHTYKELSEKHDGWIFPDPEDMKDCSVPYKRYERGALRPDGKPGFRTPTGKVELYTTMHEQFGIDPLPFYVEPPESELATPELFKKYPLVMVTGRRSPMFFHSEHRMIPWLRVCDPDPIVEVNPDLLKEKGICDGDWVWVENDRGRIRRKVKANYCMDKKCVSVPHGWWLPETDGPAPDFYKSWEINCNLLTPVDTQSSSGYGGGAYKTTLCRIRKIEAGEACVTPPDYPDAAGKDGI